MIGRIVRSADFERVLGTPVQARSTHFAVHYLRSRPSVPRKPGQDASANKLSTGQAPEQGKPVDDSADGCWLGAVVPKRHARRAVTRNLLKRQIRQAACGQPALPAGLWVVRLRAGFATADFPSAASDALRAAAGQELHDLLANAARRAGRGDPARDRHA